MKRRKVELSMNITSPLITVSSLYEIGRVLMKDLDQSNLDPNLMVIEVVTILMSLSVRTSWGILIEQVQLIKDNKTVFFTRPNQGIKRLVEEREKLVGGGGYNQKRKRT